MIARHTFPAAILLAVSILSSTAEGQKQRGLKIISVSDLLFQSDAPRPARLGKITARREDERASLLSYRPFACLQEGEFVDLLRETAGDIADEVSLVLRGDSLFVTGNPDHVTKIAEIVLAMRQVITQRFAVRSRLYRIDEHAEFPAQATQERLQALTRDLVLVWSAETNTVSGQQVALAQERFTRYVSDVDVEVSEEISVAHPVTGAVFQGIRLVVESHALVSTTDRVFKCQFAIGENEGPIELQSTGSRRDMPSIGIPNVRATSGSFSGRVSLGGALLVTIQSRAGAGSNFLLVVQADANPNPAPTKIGSNTILLPISALTTPSLQHGMLRGAPDENDVDGARGGYLPVEFADDKNDRTGRGAALVSLLRESLGELLDDEGGELNALSNGTGHGFLFIRGSDALRNTGTRILTQIQERSTRGIEVHVRTEVQDGPKHDSPFSKLSTDPTRAVLHALTYPTMLGDTSIMFKGVESAAVQDYSPEIAKKATLSNPWVQTTFRGVTAVLHPSPHGQDVAAEFRCTLTQVRPTIAQRPNQESVGVLHHIQVDRAEFRRSGPVRLGKVIPLGYGPPLRSETRSLRMHQTVRFRKL